MQKIREKETFHVRKMKTNKIRIKAKQKNNKQKNQKKNFYLKFNF